MTTPPPIGAPPGPRPPIERGLRSLRAAVRFTLLTQRAMALAWGVLLASAGLGALDYLLRLPTPLRACLLAIGLVTLSALAWRRLVPVLRFSPSLTTLALRLERTAAGRAAGLPDRLASAVELTGDPRPGAAATVEEAGPRFQRAFARASHQAIDRSRLRRAAGLVVGSAVLITGAFMAWPLSSTVATRRVLTPWAGADYPKRTRLADVTALVAHPRGQALPLRAIVSTSADVRDDVRVYFRVLRGQAPGPWRTMLLNAQGAAGSAHLAAAHLPPRLEGTLFEGLVEPAADAGEGEVALEYWFQADDNRTEVGRVILASPPALASAEVEVAPPPYAAPFLAPGREPVIGARPLSVFSNERAVVGPILAGSRLTLRLDLSKDVPVPSGDSLDAALFLATTFPGDLPADFAAEHAGRRWTLSFTLDRSMSLPVVLVDEYGIRSDDRTSFRFEAVPDQPPTATVSAPARDQSVLATAVIDAQADARDDVGLERLDVLTQRHRPDPTSGSRVPVPAEEPASAAQATPDPPSPTAPTNPATGASVSLRLELATMDLSPGDELWLLARAADTHEAQGQRRPPTVSRPRRLRIISETELVEQFRAELGVVRRVAAQSDADQRRLMRELDEPAAEGEALERDRRASQAQSSIGQRLGPALQLLEELSDRLEQNRLRDEAIAGIIAQAADSLSRAGEASDRAAGTLQDAGASRREEATRRDLEERARREQETVRDELTRAMDVLDQGQEGWQARRAIERLIEDQRRLANQTREAAEQTAGREADELNDEERRTLDRLAQQQQDVAQRSEQAASDLRSAAERTAESDRATSESLSRAANQAQQAQLARQQRQAAEQIRQNQPGQAQQLQQQSRQTLEQMLKELEQAARRRDEVLSRQLSDLVQTLDRLIKTQEGEIAGLARALGGQPAEPPDAGMRALHRDTLAIAEEVEAGPRELAAVAPTISAAGDAQARAIAPLRASPADFAAADPHERESLQRLAQARADAEELLKKSQQRDLRRRRGELAGEYAKALDEQRAIIAQCEPLAGRELSRRDRVVVRRVGQRQEALRLSLDELRTRTSDLAETTVFLFAHRRIDAASRSASGPLAEGEAPLSALRDQRTVATILAGLVEALKNPEDDNPFREDEQGGGSGGGEQGQQQPPLVPELAELRLLRLMQEEAAERTRTLGEPDARGDPAEVAAVAALQRELAEQARALLEKLMQEQGGRPAGPRRQEPAP
ncbi:MAG: hypothetical protein FJ255_00205 [Phycisphaerae bacterium]|nr:hypothetical protein [Phycisphaerae bacterium]